MAQKRTYGDAFLKGCVKLWIHVHYTTRHKLIWFNNQGCCIVSQ